MPAVSERHLLETDWFLECQALLTKFKDFPIEEFQNLDDLQGDFACPCCKREIVISKQHNLQNLHQQFFRAAYVLETLYRVPSSWYSYSHRNFYSWFQGDYPWQGWACDDCIEEGISEVANFGIAFLLNLQARGSRRPYFYFDHTYTCSTCNKAFVYTKGEQRWANEIFVISLDSNLNDCIECRRTKNRKRWLQKIVTLARAEPTFENLESAAELLFKYQDPRALEYLRRAKNKAPNLEQRLLLETKISALVMVD